MDMKKKARFLELWQTYFNGAELPVAFFYTDGAGRAELVKPAMAHQCFIGVLARVRKGTPLCFDVNSIGCGGGRRFLGFTQEIMPDFEYFLSCGLPGRVEGERYKKSPELVKAAMAHMPTLVAPSRFIVFKRWDRLEAGDQPEVVIFFARPDVLSGLFTLANFAEDEPNGVIAPFSSGCGAIVTYPYLERGSERPRGVLGMFDVSARPYIPEDRLTFAMPLEKFSQMLGNMTESFLTTSSWQKVRNRIKG